MLAQDYKLTAAGAAADGEDPLDAGAPEVGPDGWDGLDGVYAFRYADATGERGREGGGMRWETKYHVSGLLTPSPPPFPFFPQPPAAPPSSSKPPPWATA